MQANDEGQSQLNAQANKLDTIEAPEENEDNSTFEHDATCGESKEAIEGEGDELLTFLQAHDLLDMKTSILSAKLTLEHLKQVEKNDLDGLCDKDLKLSSAQKIRLKHAIKILQREVVRGGIREKIRGKVSHFRSMAPRPIAVSDDEKNTDNVRTLRSKVVIVGQAAVGKTTLQKAMMGWEFEDGAQATYAVHSVHHKSSYAYQDYEMMIDYEIFDTPGLDRFADLITLYLRGALALLVVYDVNSVASFAKAKWWIEYLESNASGYDKIILIANKTDVHKQRSSSSTADDDSDIITEGRIYATEHGIAFLEVSAKTNDNVAVLLSWLNRQSKKKVAQNPHLVQEKPAIQLHEGMGRHRGHKAMDMFHKFSKIEFEFDASKCCAL